MPDINQMGFTGSHVLSKSQILAQKDSLYSNSFRDLPDRTVYRDPLGMRTGQEVRLQEKFWEAAKKDGIIEMWDDYQRKGFSVSETVREIRKNLDTGDWSLPLDFIPEVFVVNPNLTPMADLLARETTRSDTVNATRRSSHPSISWGLEQTDDTEGSYDYADPGYNDTTFDVTGYGAASRIEDKMILAANQLRAAESEQQSAFMRAMRIEEESQIILGTNNDASGWNGFDDLGTVDVDLGSWSSVTNWDQQFRELIDEAERQGAPRDRLAVVTDFDTHREVRNDLTGNVRYNDPESELMAGFSTLTLDDVPIFKSHAIPRGSNLSGSDNNIAYAVNMNATYLAMLQEVSVKPLAKVAPQEQFAVDSYGTLVSEENGAHIRILEADS